MHLNLRFCQAPFGNFNFFYFVKSISYKFPILRIVIGQKRTFCAIMKVYKLKQLRNDKLISDDILNKLLRKNQLFKARTTGDVYYE